jgi:hypothetical protein
MYAQEFKYNSRIPSSEFGGMYIIGEFLDI